MADARDEILGRIRAALVDVPTSERAGDVLVARQYRRTDDRPRDELVTLFGQRVSDYRAVVRRVAAAALGDAITQALEAASLNPDVAEFKVGVLQT